MKTTTQRHAARILWVAPGRVYAPGELRVREGRVVAVGPATGRRVPDRILLPGLVNAHVHLQLPSLKRAQREFLPWVRAVMAERFAMSDAQLQQQAASSLAALRAEGVVAVGEIDSTGLSKSPLRTSGMAGVCYREITGFHLGRAAAHQLLDGLPPPGTRRCRSGWSPHAPYSVSPALLRAVVDRAAPRAIHVAETQEELEFLQRGTGPFRDLLAELGRLPARFRAPALAPIAYLDRFGLIGPRTTLIHCQHMDAEGAALVARTGAPVVVCPGTIRYFRRSPPPVPQWLQQGIRVALGTDSRASNTRLSLWHEMALARRMWPELTPAQVWTMATRHGGAALQHQGLGTLRVGAPAHFLSFDGALDLDAALDEITRGGRPVDQVFVGGVASRVD